MRLIGHLPAEADARRFVDYLLTRRVAAHAEEGAGGWQIWVEDDDQLDAGRDELRQFQAAPADPRYDAAAAAPVLRRQQEKAEEKRRRNYRDVRTTVFAAPNHAAVPVTMIVIGIAVAVFVILNFGGITGEKAERFLLFDDYKVDNVITAGTRWVMFDSVSRGQLWRLITPAFSHKGLLHLAFNMLWMLDLGRRIEPVKGGQKFIGLVLGIAIFSNLAQAGWTAVSPFNEDHYGRFLGMSGVVAGLFGYAWACGRFRPYERIGVTSYETGMMVGWLALCSTGLVGPIANAAHWGGLVVGFVLGAAPTWLKKLRG